MVTDKISNAKLIFPLELHIKYFIGDIEQIIMLPGEFKFEAWFRNAEDMSTFMKRVMPVFDKPIEIDLRR